MSKCEKPNQHTDVQYSNDDIIHQGMLNLLSELCPSDTAEDQMMLPLLH